MSLDRLLRDWGSLPDLDVMLKAWVSSDSRRAGAILSVRVGAIAPRAGMNERR